MSETQSYVVKSDYCVSCKKFRYLIDNHCQNCFKRLNPDKDLQIGQVDFISTIKKPRSQDKQKSDEPKARRVKIDRIEDENKLKELLPKLKSGDAWYDEASTLLGWTKNRVMYTYRRIKNQGVKKSTTEELLFSILTSTPQSVGEIAGQSFLEYPWVYQCLARMAKSDKRIKIARSNEKNKLLYYV